MQTRTLIPLMALLCALAMSAAACSSSGSSSSASTPPPSSAPATSAPAGASAPAAGGSAEKAIAANWTAFFNAKTPVAQRVSLLQDGQQFASVIQAQAGNPLASSATAKVTKVTVTSPTQATVIYSILVGGSTGLANQKGVAVLQGGTWKVGVASFCSLLALDKQFGLLSGALPAACNTAA